MKKTDYKKILPHLAALAIFLILSGIYFRPVFSGLSIVQSDLHQGKAMSKHLKDYHDRTGKFASWNDAMFSGGPSYLTTDGVDLGENVFGRISYFLTLGGRHLDMGALFFLMLGFYVMLLAFGVNAWLALIGALAYAFGSYNIIIIGVGHLTKAWAMAVIPCVIGGIVMVLRQQWWGAILFVVALGMQVVFGHPQISYYTLITALILVIVYAVFAIKQKQIRTLVMAGGILLVGGGLAVLPSLGRLWVTQEYAKETMRGGAVLKTAHPSDVCAQKDHPVVEKNEKGLDIDYAFQWSYGIGETFTLMIPDIRGGGGSDHRYEANWKNRMQALQSQKPVQANNPSINQIANRYLQDTYWGEQMFTAGPFYVGAIICFLFLLGFFLVKGPERWWILLAFILSIMMSWGKYLGWNEWLFYHLPLYNKFRAPSMILVISHVMMVLMAMLALKWIWESNHLQDAKKPLFMAGGITGGLCLLFAILPDMFFSFSRSTDELYQTTLGQPFLEALYADRKALLRTDAFRSFLFIALAFLTLYLFVAQKMKNRYWLIAVLGVLVFTDLWTVDKRYLNDENFKKSIEQSYFPTPADEQIFTQASHFKDNRYRVLDLSTSTFQDARSSYFHSTIGGYHPAKLRRYQDIIDFYLGNQNYRYTPTADEIAKNPLKQSLTHMNWHVLNMLNTRYLIAPSQQGQPAAFRNPDALGEAWFVQNVQWANNPDEEILALNTLNTAESVVVDRIFQKENPLKDHYPMDSLATIEWIPSADKNPDHHTYASKTATEQVAVFSEIYYADGWKAFIDGIETPHFRANYVLRGLVIPAGDHKIEFRFEPPLVKTAQSISLWGNIIAVLCLAAGVWWLIRRQRKTTSMSK